MSNSSERPRSNAKKHLLNAVWLAVGIVVAYTIITLLK